MDKHRVATVVSVSNAQMFQLIETNPGSIENIEKVLKKYPLSSIENSEKLTKNIEKTSCIGHRQSCKTIKKELKKHLLLSIENIDKRLKNTDKISWVHRKVPMFRAIEIHPVWIDNIDRLLKNH
jgi:hypothetical protein